MNIKYVMFPNSRTLRMGEEEFTMKLFTDIIVSWCIKHPEITTPESLLDVIETYDIPQSYMESMTFFIDNYYTQYQRSIKKFRERSLF